VVPIDTCYVCRLSECAKCMSLYGMTPYKAHVFVWRHVFVCRHTKCMSLYGVSIENVLVSINNVSKGVLWCVRVMCVWCVYGASVICVVVSVETISLLSHQSRYYHINLVTVTSISLLSHQSLYCHINLFTVTSISLLSHQSRYCHSRYCHITLVTITLVTVTSNARRAYE